MFKKTLMLFSTIFLAYFTNSSNHSNQTITDGHWIRSPIKTDTKKKANEIDHANDDFGDFKESIPLHYDDSEIISQNSIELRSEDATKDQYENNDSIETATLISPSHDSDYIPTDYSRVIYGTIHRNEWLFGTIKGELDVDYYRFDLYGKAKVTIDLTNVPSNCDYDLELYEHSNTRYAESDQVSLVGRSARANNSDEHVSATFFPGIYYIRVGAFYDTFNAKDEYKLSLNVEYTPVDASISEMRYSKDIKAALWVSDYDPFGIQAFTSQSKTEVGYLSSNQYFSTYKFANPIFDYINSNDYIRHASLYIWDLDLRKALYEIVKVSLTQLEAEFSSNESLRIGFDFVTEIIDGVNTITGIILSFIPVANAAPAIKTFIDIFGIISAVNLSIIECIFDAIMPQSLIESQSNYINYLRVLKAALECNSTTSDQEVIKIDSNYKIVKEHVPGIVQINYDIDFTPSVQSNYLYESDTIPAFQKEARFIGTIYPLKTLDDINAARNKNVTEYSDTNTGGDTELLLDTPSTSKINVGEYKWYHFTAPDNGVYTFQTSSDMDTYGELFHQIIPGQSIDGLIKQNDDGGENRNFLISYQMFKGRTLYLRVRGFSWKATGVFSVYVKKTDELTLIEEHVTGSDFGYQNEYVDNLSREPVVLDSGFSFVTQRIRCGYINKQYLTLSAKCKNAGLAYLQMDFTQDIQSFDFSMAIWSNEEYLNQNSKITLETKNKSGNYNIEYTFNIAEISKNKDALNNYSFAFNKETYGIRIKVTTNQVNYEKNKGRVVLSDFKIKHL